MKQCFQKVFTGVLADACPELGFEQIRLTPIAFENERLGCGAHDFNSDQMSSVRIPCVVAIGWSKDTLLQCHHKIVATDHCVTTCRMWIISGILIDANEIVRQTDFTISCSETCQMFRVFDL